MLAAHCSPYSKIANETSRNFTKHREGHIEGLLLSSSAFTLKETLC